MRPLSLQLALSAIHEGLNAIRDGKTAEGVRLIEHGAEYLKENAEPEMEAAE